MTCSCFDNAEFSESVREVSGAVAANLLRLMSTQNLCETGKRRFLAMCLLEVSSVSQIGVGWIESEMASLMAETRRGAN